MAKLQAKDFIKDNDFYLDGNKIKNATAEDIENLQVDLQKNHPEVVQYIIGRDIDVRLTASEILQAILSPKIPLTHIKKIDLYYFNWSINGDLFLEEQDAVYNTILPKLSNFPNATFLNMQGTNQFSVTKAQYIIDCYPQLPQIEQVAIEGFVSAAAYVSYKSQIADSEKAVSNILTSCPNLKIGIGGAIEFSELHNWDDESSYRKAKQEERLYYTAKDYGGADRIKFDTPHGLDFYRLLTVYDQSNDSVEKLITDIANLREEFSSNKYSEHFHHSPYGRMNGIRPSEIYARCILENSEKFPCNLDLIDDPVAKKLLSVHGVIKETEREESLTKCDTQNDTGQDKWGTDIEKNLAESEVTDNNIPGLHNEPPEKLYVSISTQTDVTKMHETVEDTVLSLGDSIIVNIEHS